MFLGSGLSYGASGAGERFSLDRGVEARIAFFGLGGTFQNRFFIVRSRPILWPETPPVDKCPATQLARLFRRTALRSKKSA
jgi:hypothetical protein